MSDAQSSKKINLDSKIKEADVYYSMGLLTESLSVYEQALKGITEQGSTDYEKIKEKIDALKNEIATQDEVDAQNLSAQDISNFKKTKSIFNRHY